jgi:hypothetical protein
MVISQVQLRGCIYFDPSLGTDQQVENKATDYSFFDEHLEQRIHWRPPYRGKQPKNLATVAAQCCEHCCRYSNYIF